MVQPVLLTHARAPGDVTVMTACIRDLALTHPGEYEIHVGTRWRELWENNPYIAGTHGLETGITPRYRLDYGPSMSRLASNRMHFIAAFHRALSGVLKVDVPVLFSKPDLHLSEQERTEAPISGRYWCVLAGGKTDMTAKIWSAARWQQTIDLLAERGINCVQVGALKRNHIQPALKNTLSLLDRTSLRDLVWLIHHADGVICHVTCAMHMAAALDKPCVVLAGGREHWWWEAYTNAARTFGDRAAPVPVPHRFLHTQGLLACCKDNGCWRNKVSSSEQDKKRSYCRYPCDDGFGQQYPTCMHLITPQHVVDAVLSYYEQCPTTHVSDLSSANRDAAAD